MNKVVLISLLSHSELSILPLSPTCVLYHPTLTQRSDCRFFELLNVSRILLNPLVWFSIVKRNLKMSFSQEEHFDLFLSIASPIARGI